MDEGADPVAIYQESMQNNYDPVPMQLFLKSTKLLSSSSSRETLMNNVLKKEVATPCDGLSESMGMTFNETPGGVANHPYRLTMLDEKNFPETTILDSI